MIRRELPAQSELPARWVLIPQIEHARLAGRLAESWGGGDFAPLAPRDEVLWAVFHHDDGWRDWDQTPDVDPQRGTPRSFTEMRILDSLAIWSASIDAARQAGPLEGHVVAGHFCALARRGAAWHRGDPAWPHAEAFLAEYEALGQTWLAAWRAQHPRRNTPEVAARALEHVQFFDALSLWFCCSPPSCPDEIDPPGGPTLRIVPDDRQNLRFSPWPFTVVSLNLEVAGRRVPPGHYASREALAAAPAQPVQLAWHLRPAE